jgi:hypothetical protein
MENESPHLGFMLNEVIPDELIAKYQQEIFHPKLKIGVIKYPVGTIYNSLEWAIPTFFCMYLLKTYFDSFLSEAGKDHYGILKEWIKKTSNNLRLVKVQTIAAAVSTDKLIKDNSQSKSFSIEIITKENKHKIKFLFDNNFSEKTWNRALDKLLELLDEHFSSNSDNKISQLIEANNFHQNVWAIIISEDGDWDFFDFKKIAEENTTNNVD